MWEKNGELGVMYFLHYFHQYFIQNLKHFAFQLFNSIQALGLQAIIFTLLNR